MRVLAVVLVPFLGGCGAGVDYVIQNYRGTPLVKHEILPADGKRYVDDGSGNVVDRAKTFRIFDKPAENRLMITPSLGDAVGIGAVRGLTLMDSDSPIVVYKDAAVDWLRTTGRTCTVVDAYLIIPPQYEVKYSCEPAVSAAAAPRGSVPPVAPRRP